MPIVNKDRYPDVDWIPETEQRIIGNAEGVPLVFLGKEKGTESLILANSYTSDFKTEKLRAFPVYDLLKFSQGTVTIEEDV